MELDSEAPLVLLDQKLAGKSLVLITNNDWEYTRRTRDLTYYPNIIGPHQYMLYILTYFQLSLLICILHS